MKKIVLVDDEPTLLDTLKYNLTRQGYEVATAEDGQAGVELARRTRPDLVVLDIMLPKLDGFEVCRILRRETTVPILMLTARDEEIDKVLGLELGADDYLTKPFSLREFMARVKAMLRRAEMGDAAETAEVETLKAPEAMTFGDLRIDLGARQVTLGEQTLTLKPREFDLLVFLARHRGMALSREVLLERVWGYDYPGESRTVDVHIRWLREKIEAEPSRPVHLLTVRGLGYRFTA
jgi:DNA-binding response OmpR family regulator